MKVESGFLGKENGVDGAGNLDEVAAVRLLSESASGFFRIFVGKHFGRKVIIKTLKEDAADNPIAIAKLKKEFSVMFPLDSPNIVHAFRFVNLDGGIPAIEMEWCGGSDIRELMNEGLSAEDIHTIIEGVLNGLTDIHREGIVHRDIKPENVIYDPYRKVVKIIDFGSAYAIDGATLQGPDGTLGYTPEDKMQPGSEPELKDDLYALGIMTAEMADSIIGSGGKLRLLRKKLHRFSERLINGKYDNAALAEADFEKITRLRIKLNPVVVAAVSVGVTALLFLLVPAVIRHPQTETVESVELKPDSAITAAVNPPGEDSAGAGHSGEILPQEIDEVALVRPEAEASMPDAEKESNVVYVPKMPYKGFSGLPEEDEEAFHLAYAAGPLLNAAESNNAALKVKMDAFPIQFCDSLWHRTNEFKNKYPGHMEEDDIRLEAKKLAERYGDKMEREFRRRFGETGDPHRRSVLLQGRFYSSLHAYHYNPYAKAASDGKSK